MKKSLCIILAVSMTACASYRPIIDTKGVDMAQYELELKDCQQIAEQVQPGNDAAAGAAAGAIFGALLGAAVGGNRNMAGYGAGIGAAQGVGYGAAYGATSQIAVVKRCMMGRGYKVLN